MLYSVCYHQHNIKYQFCHRYNNLPSYIQLYHNIIYHMFFIYIYMISLLYPTWFARRASSSSPCKSQAVCMAYLTTTGGSEPGPLPKNGFRRLKELSHFYYVILNILILLSHIDFTITITPRKLTIRYCHFTMLSHPVTSWFSSTQPTIDLCTM